MEVCSTSDALVIMLMMVCAGPGRDSPDGVKHKGLIPTLMRHLATRLHPADLMKIHESIPPMAVTSRMHDIEGDQKAVRPV